MSPLQSSRVAGQLSFCFDINFFQFFFFRDLSAVIDPLRELFTFQDSNELRYGQLVLPWLTNNFGPMYFSKITRRD